MTNHPNRKATSEQRHIRSFASAPLAKLIHAYWVAGEAGGESETKASRDFYSAQIKLIEAIGHYRFGYEWDAALDASH